MTYKKPDVKKTDLVTFILLFFCIGFTTKDQASSSNKPFIKQNILKTEVKNYLNSIQEAYDEIEKYQLDGELSQKNVLNQEIVGLLRKGSFYVYHLWEMTQFKDWLSSQNSKRISKHTSDYIKKGFEEFLEKHEKIKFLLSRLSESIHKNVNPTDVKELISQLRSFHSIKLFSSLTKDSLIPSHPSNNITKVTITKVNPPYEPIDQVSYGESFRIKVIFDKDPGLDSEPVTIRVKPGKMEIQTIAYRTEDPLVYLSKPLQTVHK